MLTDHKNPEIVQRARQRGERVWITGLELFWNAGSSFGPTKGQFVAVVILPAPVLPQQQVGNQSMSAPQHEAVGEGEISLEQRPRGTLNQDETNPRPIDSAPTDEYFMAVGEQEKETSNLKESHHPAAEEQKELTLTLQEKPEILFRTWNNGRLRLDPTIFAVGDILEMHEYEGPEASSGGIMHAAFRYKTEKLSQETEIAAQGG